MTFILMALIGALVGAALCALLGSYLGSRNYGIAWNGQIGPSEHDCGLPGKIADVAFPSRYLLCKVGTDWNHIALPTSPADQPYGIAIDQPGAGDPSTVRLPGAHKGTQTMIANGAIANNADIYSAGDGSGQVMPEPAIAGTFWKVGRVVGIASTATGDMLEVEAIEPVKVVIIAVLTSAQIVAAPTEANFNALQADVAALATALAHPTLVKHL